MAVINYAQLSDLKVYLGISGTTEDTSLNALLLQSYYLINTMVGIDTFNQGTKTEVVEKVYADGVMFLHNIPVTEVLTINSTSYSGTINEDYQILRNRRVQIKDISDYLLDLEFNNFEITYTAGYDRDQTGTTPGAGDTLPEDIKTLQMMLVDGMRNKAGSEGLGSISEYKLGEEAIKYGSSIKESTYLKENDIPVFKSLLERYKIKDVYPV